MGKNQRGYCLVFCCLMLVILSACGQDTVPTPTSMPTATITPTEILPTDIPTTLPTDTPTPEPTPIPGVQVYPVTSFDAGIPWLPLNEDERPMSVYFGFNLEKPPFDNVLVRQAFAAAIDREEIAQAASGYKFQNVSPATSLTPSMVLGRDLYGQVGIPFDPTRAKELMQQAGYSTTDSFPTITLIVYMRGEASPGAYYQLAKMTARMWQEYLGVTVIIDAIGNAGDYIRRMESNPSEIYHLAWGADYVDPDNFLNELFHSGPQFNFGNFRNSQFDNIVEQAASINDPAERQLLYIQAENILAEEEVGVLPLFHTNYYTQP